MSSSDFFFNIMNCDSTVINQCFFDISSEDDTFVYKTKKATVEEPRHLYFFTDPPHLIECVTNTFTISFAYNKARILLVSVCGIFAPIINFSKQAFLYHH